MKKRFLPTIWVLLLLVVCVATLSLLSYCKALRVEADVLKPCLSPSMDYNRTVRFGVLNPFVAMLPHWTITYSESPTVIGYATPSITVYLFGGVEGESKEVATSLVEKGYRGSY